MFHRCCYCQGRELCVFLGCTEAALVSNFTPTSCRSAKCAMRIACVHSGALRVSLCIQGDVMARFADWSEVGVAFPRRLASVDNTRHAPDYSVLVNASQIVCRSVSGAASHAQQRLFATRLRLAQGFASKLQNRNLQGFSVRSVRQTVFYPSLKFASQIQIFFCCIVTEAAFN